MGEDFRNRIICGDALEEMRKMPDGSFDVVITSPPYNLRNSSGSSLKGAGRSCKWKNAALSKGYDGYSDDMPEDEYIAWQRECLEEMYRLVPDTGAVFYNHKWRVQKGLMQDRREIVEGFPVRQVIIWQRAGGMNFNDGYFVPTYEVIYLIPKPKFCLRKGKNGYGDVWKINQEHSNSHPAPFPEELPRRILDATGARTVLDPFSGSGTTCAAAKRMGVEYTGIDKSEEYCASAEERIKAIGCSASLDDFKDMT